MKKIPLLLGLASIFLVLPCLPAQAQHLSLKNLTIEDNKPQYSVKADYPELLHFENAKVQNKVNETIQAKVSEAISEFRGQVTEHLKSVSPNLPIKTSSSLWINYQSVLETAQYLSLAFEVSTYFVGAAHPNTYFLTLNFDLKSGKLLSLADLFNKNSPYLHRVAELAFKEMLKKSGPTYSDKAWIRRGTAPQESNYRNWVLARQGLEILLNPYQVAPYVAGPQRLMIPYSALKPILIKHP